LKTGSDKKPEETAQSATDSAGSTAKAFTRGAAYYGGEDHGE
jgi:hypothetical protein